jgi:tetratricopeptide (TPR) repeat protein
MPWNSTRKALYGDFDRRPRFVLKYLLGALWGVRSFAMGPGGVRVTVLAGCVRIGVATFLLVTSLVAAAQSSDPIAPITSALRAGQFDRALELLQPALQQNPKSAQLWTLEGISLSGKSNKNAALDAFHHALSVSPDYLPALEGAAQIEYENGGKDAVSLLQRVLALRSHDPTSHAMLAVLAYRRGDCAAAVPHFEQSGPLIDAQPGALEAFGDCLLRLKQPERAVTVLRRAVEQASGDAAARYRLASAQLMIQRPKDALATLEPLLQQNAPETGVLELAASAYEDDGNTPEAVRVLRQAIVSDPHNVNLYVDFANVSLDHQSYQVGIDMINAGLRAEPKAAALYVARGILYVQLAQYDNAESDFEEADTLDPKQAIGSAAEGLAAIEKNDPDQALATVREKLVKEPNDAFLLYLKAEIITQRGPDPASADFRDAVASAKKAITIRPSLAAARDILAKLYLQAGENEAAIEQSRKALNTDPKDQTALYHLIQALRKSGRTEGVPNLLKELADLRAQATKEEAEHNRYKLVEQKSPLLEEQR